MAAEGGGWVKAQPKCFTADPTYGSRRTARIQCEAAPDYSLAVHDGTVVLRPHDPCDDDYQRWVKDERFSDKVKDHYGFPGFALVNKATGQAIRHATAANSLVQLVPYSREHFDETVLWTEGHDGEYQAIRMVNNTGFNLDAIGGNTVVRDGTQIGVWEWNGGTNQLWKLTYCYPADVFLWGNKKVSAVVLTVATAIWVLFELLEYHLLTLVCHALILSLAISTATTFVNKSPTCIPEVQIPEDLAVNIALALRCVINRAFSVLRDIALGRDPWKLLLVIAGLWVLSILGSTVNFLTLFCIVFAFVHTVALLYEKYEDKADAFGEKTMIEFKKHYAVFDAKVLSKIPKGPREDKKH